MPQNPALLGERTTRTPGSRRPAAAGVNGAQLVRCGSFQGLSWAVAAAISFSVMFSLPLRIAMTAAVEMT